MAQASRWLKTFERFSKDLRIKSKEVVSDDPRGAPLEFWNSQKMFMQHLAAGLDDNIHTFYFLKGRQLGITTISIALIDVFWLAVHNNMIGALVTENEKNRNNNREMIRHYIDSFPPGYFGDDFSIVKGKDNTTSMSFSNGSRLDFLVAGTRAKSTAWGEGAGYSCVHLTEVGSYAGSDGLASFEESFAQENPHRLFVYESTGKGRNVWYDRYQMGFQDPLTRRSHFLGWWSKDINRVLRSDPRYEQFGRHGLTPQERELVREVEKRFDSKVTPEQIAWYRWKSATTTGDESLMLEQNNPWTDTQAFIITGYSFFQVRQIGRELKHIHDNPEEFGYIGYRYNYGSDFFHEFKLEHLDPDQLPQDEIEEQVELKVWEEPAEGGRYVIGMDPAYGRNEHGDCSVIEVWRCFADVMVQVAEYRSNAVDVTRSSWVLAHLAGVYRDCVINLEITGPGTNVMQEIDSLRGRLKSDMYADVVRSRDWEDAMGWARWYLFHRPDSPGRGYVYNWKTGGEYQQRLMTTMQGAHITKGLVIRSERLLLEMQNVRNDDGHIGAPESRSDDCKDDTVFATALAIRAWTDHRRTEMIAEGLTRERVENEATGKISLVTQRVNSLVYRFLKTADEMAANPPEIETFRSARGL